jgi:DHA2 family multidrug resistance protein-like MFS transporter
LFSVAMSLGSVLLWIYGLKHAAQDGFDQTAAASIGAGLLIGVAFIRRQLWLEAPLLNLSLFRRPAFSV